MGEMKVATHTKGPWHVQDNTAQGPNGQLRVDTGDGTVADCGRGRFADAEARANAALIAAAPDLLAALRSLQAFAAACDARLTDMGRGLSRDFEHGDVLRFARAAIARVEGRT